MFATKETAMISVAVLVIALAMTWAYRAGLWPVWPGSEEEPSGGDKLGEFR